MPANVSVTSLCNRSLAQIGGKAQIGNPNEESAAARACNLLFSPTFQMLARSARWNCLEKQVTLSLLLAAAETPENSAGTPPFPPEPWIYEYQLPSDCLMGHYILPTFPPNPNSGGTPPTTASVAGPLSLRGRGQIPFKIMTDTDPQGVPRNIIVTNQQQAIFNYTADIQNPAIWDTQFQAAFVASLAAFLVPALSMHMPLMSMQIQLAERIIAEARAKDGNEGSNSQDNIPDWIRSRSGGADGYYSGYSGGSWFGGYCSMAWPAFA